MPGKDTEALVRCSIRGIVRFCLDRSQKSQFVWLVSLDVDIHTLQ